MKVIAISAVAAVILSGCATCELADALKCTQNSIDKYNAAVEKFNANNADQTAIKDLCAAENEKMSCLGDKNCCSSDDPTIKAAMKSAFASTCTGSNAIKDPCA